MMKYFKTSNTPNKDIIINNNEILESNDILDDNSSSKNKKSTNWIDF